MRGPFDTYTFWARVAPALLCLLPVAFTQLLWRDLIVVRLWPLVLSAAALFFLANAVRSSGKRLEKRLIDRWNGLPTTHMLRHAEVDNAVIFRRRREAMERFLGRSLPTPRKERNDPTGADQEYVAAVRQLINRVREQPDRYPRLHEENIHYGYRRNLLGIKPLALVTLAVLLIVDGAVLLNIGSVMGMIVTAAHLFLLLGWLVIVRERWVREQGETYAERLFETLEDPALLSTAKAARSDE